MNDTEKFEDEFDIELMEEIGKQTISQFLEKMHYNDEKTNFWVSQILDTTLKELSKLNKPFKYVATCTLMEKNGSPLTTSNVCLWNENSDGLCSVQMGNETLDCILCIYAIKT
ncbi:dynein light chain, putative [Plasmodium knowlesi strain H]|uniref:Dynein light chain, putative n=4 Tax=Plasmodium TaxID=5820 RepID=A0A5K1UVN4_PLAKH|nr:dynein light chain, putative [Plasmodium knowlesi strain H]XP_019914088.1 Dynein light chain [Plasmodium coatneyi]OTN67323.1 putative Dynein light chain [Plasmodium knowlesi]ANQ07393.1 Dynein light chain [Plasmodium coatneyi]CAA9987548.1 dynein light chain, putative [Plasmodium knowlesi strain H]SBO23079.1 dynein light chain, putative [Plasmodium knowlesi strain H]SBO23744.1 dynein light chain, putative [Plasmodium knowlesi strain H]|eukprot:XP_002258550.1 dynein light chain, putative [Plasmodium knowlesi strain H]